MRYLFLFLIVCFFFSCGGDDDNTVESEMALIEDYISRNNLTAESTNSGLYYVIETLGVGEHPTINSTVEVHYRGFFLNGEVFDESPQDMSITFPLTRVIRGWQEGIPLFKKGGKGLLLIPSSLAYGTAGRGNIPPNTPLIFEVELIDFE